MYAFQIVFYDKFSVLFGTSPHPRKRLYDGLRPHRIQFHSPVPFFVFVCVFCFTHLRLYDNVGMNNNPCKCNFLILIFLLSKRTFSRIEFIRMFVSHRFDGSISLLRQFKTTQGTCLLYILQRSGWQCKRQRGRD